jgi:hypothetical protein
LRHLHNLLKIREIRAIRGSQNPFQGNRSSGKLHSIAPELCNRHAESDVPLFPTAMKRPILVLVSALLLSAFPAAAKDDAPRGFSPISELKEAQAKAVTDKKLVVLVVKGKDDECPNCAAALENGEKAIGSGVVKVFARAETIGKEDASAFPPALQARVKQHFTTGAAVTFVVFDPAMSKIIVEAGRKELQSDKKATAEFKKTVQEAKKALK